MCRRVDGGAKNADVGMGEDHAASAQPQTAAFKRKAGTRTRTGWDAAERHTARVSRPPKERDASSGESDMVHAIEDE